VAANSRFTTADLYGPALHALGATELEYSLASFRYDCWRHSAAIERYQTTDAAPSITSTSAFATIRMHC